MLIFCVCFFTTMQAQDAKWTLEQTDKAKREVKLINDVIALTANQKGLLTDILLRKNRSLERLSKLSMRRRNLNVETYLTRIENVLRYGREINSNQKQQKLLGFNNAEETKELLTKKMYTEKIVHNEGLINELNLNIINE